MKNFILFLIGILFYFSSNAQTDDTTKYIPYLNQYGLKHARLWATKALIPPIGDTTNRNPGVVGALMTCSCDSVTYKWDGIGWRGIAEGGGGGFQYLFSATAPAGSDTGKIWIKTPAFCAVYDVYTYVTSIGWTRYGWLSVDGVFSKRRPINEVICGQSNAAGISIGGDTARFSGLIGYTTGAENFDIDRPTFWDSVHIGKSPFFENKNNIAFQVAKRLKKNGDADIIRVISCYEGGTGLDLWINGGNGHYLLDTLRNRLTRSGIDTIDIFLWHQGESGGVTNASAGGYVVDQRVLYDSLCSPLTPGFFRNHTKYIAAGLGTDTLETAVVNIGSPSGGQQTLNFDNNLNTAWVPAWGLHTIDGIHFTATSLDSLGYRYYTEVKRLPHAPYEEYQPWNWDLTYDLRTARATNLIPYSGGGTAYKEISGTSIGYRLSGNNVFVLNANTAGIDVGNANSLGYTLTDQRFRLNGRGIISSDNASLILGGNFNITGTIQQNVVMGNYASNFSLTNGFNFSTIIGYNAISGVSRIPDNSVIVGHEAGLSSSHAGSGDYETFVGKSSGQSSSGYAKSFFGAYAGASALGDLTTAIGASSGAITSDSTMSNSSALGASAKWDRSNQIALGDANITQFKVGTKRFRTDQVPSNGQVWTYNSTSGVSELSTLASSISDINSQTGASQTISGGPGISVSSTSNVHTVAFNTNLESFLADANNTGTSETDLYSHTLSANKLITNGNTVRFVATGTFNDATSTNQIQAYFAGTNIFNSTALAISATGDWRIEMEVARTTSTTGRASVVFYADNATVAAPVKYTALTGVDYTTTNIFKITGTAAGAGGGSNDITAVVGKVVFIP